MAESGSLKMKNRGMIIGSVVGAVVLIAIIVCVLVFSKGSIRNLADFRAAIADQRAINCVVTQGETNEFTLQTTKGFEKVRMVIVEDGITQNLLAIRGDATYFWGGNGNGTGYKTSDFSAVDEFIDAATRAVDEDEEVEGYKFDCKSSGRIDFSVPEDVEFVSLDAPEED